LTTISPIRIFICAPSFGEGHGEDFRQGGSAGLKICAIRVVSTRVAVPAPASTSTGPSATHRLALPD
jgi:hypothetical protein